MSRAQSFIKSSTKNKSDPLLNLWILRILVPLGGQKEFVQPHGFSNDIIAEQLGLEEWINPLEYDFDPQTVNQALRALYVASESRQRLPRISGHLATNLKRLSGLVGLSKDDCQILGFVTLLQHEPALNCASDTLGELSSMRVFQVLSKLLDLPRESIQSRLSAGGALGKSGLVNLFPRRGYHLEHKLELISRDFAETIVSFDANPTDLLRNLVLPSSPGELKIDNYPHIEKEVGLLSHYLKSALTTGRAGVNILLYGKPGTGKSQLAKVLAQRLKCDLFEVASEDAEGDPIKAEKRLSSFRAAQNFFAVKKSLILFDEVEDIFSDGDYRNSLAQQHKAWINKTLQANPVPTIWISNSSNGLDNAFIRRFDMVFELPVPPQAQRLQILQETCSGLLSSELMERMASSEELVPALVTRTNSVVSLIQNELGKKNLDSSFELLINNTLETQGYSPVPAKKSKKESVVPDVYDPAYINADIPIEGILEGLQKAQTGRLCLYGPPGTGKTAYGCWLAEQLDKPLLVKRGSDIFGKYVGETEERTAKAFKEAHASGAVLMIDEVDSFLQDRRSSQQSWEITGVNEMLTQLESFNGIFVASTNLIDGLDQAALRRFDLKMKFGYLSALQLTGLYKAYCTKMSLPQPKISDIQQVTKLHNVTPGDFAVMVRRHLFHPIANATELARALAQECSLKEGSRNPIGFIQ